MQKSVKTELSHAKVKQAFSYVGPTEMSITANKMKGIRAAVCYNLKSTRLSRQHNDANIISLGSRLLKRSALNFVSLFKCEI